MADVKNQYIITNNIFTKKVLENYDNHFFIIGEGINYENCKIGLDDFISKNEKLLNNKKVWVYYAGTKPDRPIPLPITTIEINILNADEVIFFSKLYYKGKEE